MIGRRRPLRRSPVCHATGFAPPKCLVRTLPAESWSGRPQPYAALKLRTSVKVCGTEEPWGPPRPLGRGVRGGSPGVRRRSRCAGFAVPPGTTGKKRALVGHHSGVVPGLVAAERVPCGRGRQWVGGRAIPPVAAANAWWARPGRSAAALVPGLGGWSFLLVPVFPWPARPVTLAALAWWCQSWAVHSMTSRRVGRAG